jgi:hypothetical protein
MPRQAVPADKLYALLQREYQQSRVVDCVTRCPMPRPVFRDADGTDAANWHVIPGLKCPRHCERIIADAAARLAAVYDIEPPARS